LRVQTVRMYTLRVFSQMLTGTLLVLLSLLSTRVAAEPVTSLRVLSLAEARAQALAANRDLRQAGSAIRGAEAGVQIAGVRPNAQLSLNAMKVRPWAGVGTQYQDSVMRIDQTFERGGKRDLRLSQAGALLEAANADLVDTRRQLRAAVDSAYWRLKVAESAVSVATADRESYTRLLQISRLRFSAGDLAGTALARIEAEAVRASTDFEVATALQRDAQAALAALLAAESAAAGLHTRDAWPEPASASADVDLAAVIERRPDVVAAEARRRAALTQIDLARAQRTRDVTIGVQVERDENHVNSVGVGVSVPLFTGNDYSGDIAAASAVLTSAEILLEQLRGQARGELERLRVRLDTSAETARRYRQDIVPRTEKAHAGVLFAYESGATSVLDLLDSLRALRAVRRSADEAYADFATTLSDWQAALNQDLMQ